MDLLKDLWLLLLTCIKQFASLGTFNFRIVLLTGFFLGIVCWIACSYYSRLWNLRYRITIMHHIFCGIAAVMTLVFTLIFSGLQYTKEATYMLINIWQQYEIRVDESWKQDTFKKVYDNVKALGIEDFSNFSPPDDGGKRVPVTKKESYETIGRVYATEAVQHFKKAHSYLNKILWAEENVPAQVIRDDIENFFKENPGDVYSTEEAVNLAAKLINQGLEPQVPRVVTIYRIVTITLFFLVQSIPFGLIGYSAYKDLKITT